MTIVSLMEYPATVSSTARKLLLTSRWVIANAPMTTSRSWSRATSAAMAKRIEWNRNEMKITCRTSPTAKPKIAMLRSSAPISGPTVSCRSIVVPGSRAVTAAMMALVWLWVRGRVRMNTSVSPERWMIASSSWNLLITARMSPTLNGWVIRSSSELPPVKSTPQFNAW